MENKVILKVKNLNVEIGREKIIENLSFKIKEGEVLTLLGPNGAGKTVLLKALLGILPYQGEIQWQKGIKISYIPTRLSSIKDVLLTVKDFFGLKKIPQEKMCEILEEVGIGDPNFFGKQISCLSTGQFQRILVAWGLSGEPQFLLFDEPVFGIDIGGQETIYELLNKLRKERNLTILLVSHDLNIVYEFTDNVLCLNKRALCYGPPKTVLTPQNLAQLYGSEVKFYQHVHN